METGRCARSYWGQPGGARVGCCVLAAHVRKVAPDRSRSVPDRMKAGAGTGRTEESPRPLRPPESQPGVRRLPTRQVQTESIAAPSRMLSPMEARCPTEKKTGPFRLGCASVVHDRRCVRPPVGRRKTRGRERFLAPSSVEGEPRRGAQAAAGRAFGGSRRRRRRVRMSEASREAPPLSS